MEEQNKLSQEPAPQPNFVPPVPPAPQYAPYAYTQRPPVPFVSDAHEKHLLFIAAALGIALCELLLWVAPGVSVVVLAALVYGGIFAYGKGCQTFDGRRGALLDIPIALTALSCALFANPLLTMGNILLLYFLLALRVSRMFGQPANNALAAFAASGLAAPFRNLAAPFKTLRAPGSGQRSRTVGRAVLGALISVPVAAVVLALLRSADAAFDQALSRLALHWSTAAEHILLDLLVGAVLAILLFSLAYTARYGAPAAQKSDAHRLDSVIVGTVLAVCAVIYLCFFAVQFRYLFSAVWGRLPSDYIYSEYARRGFFELAAAACINLALVCFALRTQHAARPVMKGAVVLLAAETLVLIGSALSKMAMYIRVYGLTPMRLYTSVFMIGLVLVFIGLIAAQFVRFPVQNVLAVALIALYLALNFAVPNRTVAEWNVRHFESGALATVDFDLLRDLGPDAVPAVIRLTVHPDAEIRAEAQTTRAAMADDLRATQDIRSATLSGLLAAQRIHAPKS